MKYGCKGDEPAAFNEKGALQTRKCLHGPAMLTLAQVFPVLLVSLGLGTLAASGISAGNFYEISRMLKCDQLRRLRSHFHVPNLFRDAVGKSSRVSHRLRVRQRNVSRVATHSVSD